MTRVEALIDAIGKLHGIHNPDSAAYTLRNPLLMRSYGYPGQHELDGEGRRKFPSLLNGYKAAQFDLTLKINGLSRCRLTADSTLSALLATYGIRELLAIDQVVRFLRRALRDESVGRATPLHYFQKEA